MLGLGIGAQGKVHRVGGKASGLAYRKQAANPKP